MTCLLNVVNLGTGVAAKENVVVGGEGGVSEMVERDETEKLKVV